MLVALVSAKGAPGVTTTALALTVTWPGKGRCVLAECDPAGGSLLAGYLAGRLPADRGIRELAVAELRGDPLDALWWGQLIDLDPPGLQRLLLPGITDPVQAGALAPVWESLTRFFKGLALGEQGCDVIADCGRLTTPHAPWPLLAAADAVVLVVEGTLPGLAAATPAIRAMRRELGDRDGDLHRLGVVVVGRADQSGREVAAALNTPVWAQMPHDRRAARAFTYGGTVRRDASLLRAAGSAGHQIIKQVQRRAASTAGLAQVVTDGH